MLDDRYSLKDHVKFICNAKIKYQPKSRSYLQPFLFFIIWCINAGLSFGTIALHPLSIFITQACLLTLTLFLFISLIPPPDLTPTPTPYSTFT